MDKERAFQDLEKVLIFLTKLSFTFALILIDTFQIPKFFIFVTLTDHCTINTNRPFTISHSQGDGGPDGTMDYANNWFSQDGKTASFNVCDNDKNYVKNMG